MESTLGTRHPAGQRAHQRSMRRALGLLSRVPCALLLFLAGCGGAERRPNVVLITLDTTRADYFGSYGHPAGSTPHFDALAQEGVLFEMALSTASVTPVSHASILTGLYPDRHGLRVLSAGSGYRLSSAVPTLTTRLRDAGWQTAAIHSAFPVSAYFGLDQGFDHFDSFEARMEVEESQEGVHRWQIEEHQRRSDDTTDRALAFLERAGDPFFLWLHYWDPHDPILVPPEEYLAGVPAGARSPALYAAELRYVDAQFGRLMEALRERGLDDDTIVCVTADHGEGLNEHGWLFHRLLYQEQLHVPLLLRVPGEPGGRRHAGIVSTVDIAPTLLDYLGLGTLPGSDGQSLRPLVSGEPGAASAGAVRTVYADQLNGYDLNSRISRRRPLDDFLYAVVEDPWKLVYRPTNPAASELFHLREDPEEADNRFEREPEVRTRLLLQLARRGPWVTSPFEDVGGADSAAASKALEALGYGAADGGPVPQADAWEWVCPAHAQSVADRPHACGVCGEPPLMRLRL